MFKVSNVFQDVSDGEFGRAKTKFSQYMVKTRDSDYIEVLDSAGFVKFGQENMSQPGPKAGLSARLFSNLDPAEVRFDQLKGKFCTLEIG